MSTHLALMLLSAYLGIAVAKDKLDVVWRQGERALHRLFANSAEGFAALLAWLGTLPAQPGLICLEATGSYSDALCRFLEQQGYPLAVLNPAVLVAYRKSKNLRRKTDKQDAVLLAWYGQDNDARLQRTLWHPLCQPVLALRYLLNYRQNLLGMLQQENNRLHAGRFTAWTWTQVLLHSVHVKHLVRAAESHLLAHIKAHEDLKSLWLRLQTIPGIGEVTAAALIAYIGDITRFSRVGALVSLAGLALKQHESGSSVYEPARIDRHGHAALRRLLYCCAITAMRTDPSIAAWAQRLRDRGKPEKVVIVAVMRKLIHIVFGVWKTQTPYDPRKVLGAVA